MPNWTLKQLESFVWVAKLGSFRATAERLNTTQPNISVRISQLETVLGVRLFHRDSGSVALTPMGHSLLGQAERVLHHPKIIIEVLSDSTAAYDRGEKFAAYRKISDLQEYALIDQLYRRIEIFRRTENDEWLLATRDAERGLVLKSLDFLATPAEVFESLPEASSSTSKEPS